MTYRFCFGQLYFGYDFLKFTFVKARFDYMPFDVRGSVNYM